MHIPPFPVRKQYCVASCFNLNSVLCTGFIPLTPTVHSLFPQVLDNGFVKIADKILNLILSQKCLNGTYTQIDITA